MTNLSFSDPVILIGSLITGALAVLWALFKLISQWLALKVYKEDNTVLRQSLEANKKSMQAERKNQIKKIKALEQRVELLKKSNDIVDPTMGIQLTHTDVKVLRSSATFDRSEPQYKNQTDEYLLMLSRQEILKYAKDYISTEIIKKDQNRVTFEHKLQVIKQEEYDV